MFDSFDEVPDSLACGSASGMTGGATYWNTSAQSGCFRRSAFTNGHRA